MKKYRTTGQRSPRWAINETFLIETGGDRYLFRRRLVQTPWFGVYLHDIYRPDADRGTVHDHPWPFTAVVLRGGYTEIFDPLPSHPEHMKAHQEQLRGVFEGLLHRRTQRWRRWSVHKMSQGTAHRIVQTEPNTKTLVLVGPRRSSWGFYDAAGTFTDWRDYHDVEERP